MCNREGNPALGCGGPARDLASHISISHAEEKKLVRLGHGFLISVAGFIGHRRKES